MLLMKTIVVFTIGVALASGKTLGKFHFFLFSSFCQVKDFSFTIDKINQFWSRDIGKIGRGIGKAKYITLNHRLVDRYFLRHISNMNFQSWAVLGRSELQWFFSNPLKYATFESSFFLCFHDSDTGRWNFFGGPVVKGWQNLRPLVGIGLADLQNIGLV